MDADRWRRVQPMLDDALDLQGEERAAFLADVSREEPALAEELARLIAAAESDFAEGGLAACGDLLSDVHDSSSDDRARIGERIGHFRLTRLLGSGGMGAVYLAERTDDEFAQQVAIKVLRDVYQGANVRARFNRERELLAQLVHPNIAQLLDGGTTADGMPYFTMEYVDGRPIDAFCREHRPTVQGRIELLIQAANALSFAHENLIIHRDIKPSNILVRKDGVAKLVDFGIAKMATRERGATLTQAQIGPMTPEYAAPEQYTGAAISVLTDVYQFGVLAYAVLTGALPYRGDPTDAFAWAQAVTGGAAMPVTRAIGTAREPPPAGYVGALRKFGTDLDAVLQKAIEKEPSNRYRSMDAFATDLRAMLEGRPIQARRTPTSVLLWRVINRHRVTSGLAALAVVLLIATTVVAVKAAREAQQARIMAESETARAVTEAKRSWQIARFLDQMLGDLDPGVENSQRSVTDIMANIFDLARERLDQRKDTDPLVRARILTTLARAQSRMGRHADAEAGAREALDIYQRVRPEDRDFHAYLYAADTVGQLLLRRQQAAEAIAVTTAAIQSAPHDEPLLARRLSLAYHIRGNARRQLDLRKAGAADYDAAVALLARLTPEDAVGMIFPMIALAEVLDADGKYRLAAKLAVRTIDWCRSALGPAHPHVFQLLPSVARRQLHAGELEAADESARIAEQESVRIYGEGSIGAASAHLTRGYVLLKTGRSAEAMGHLELARKGLSNEVPPNRASIAEVEVLQGLVELDQSRPERALELCRAAHARLIEIGEAMRNADNALDCMSAAYAAAGRGDLAGQSATEALRIRERRYGLRHPLTLMSQYRLGAAELAQGNVADARARLHRTRAMAEAAFDPRNPYFREMVEIEKRVFE